MAENYFSCYTFRVDRSGSSGMPKPSCAVLNDGQQKIFTESKQSQGLTKMLVRKI